MQVSAEFVARTEAVPTVEIRARVSGVLEQVRFREGSAGQEGPAAVHDPAGRVQGGAPVGPRPARQGRRPISLVPGTSRSWIGPAPSSIRRRPISGRTRRTSPATVPSSRSRRFRSKIWTRPSPASRWPRLAVEAAEAALKDTVLAQRTAIQLAEAAVESAKAAVTQAELNLKYTEVESPDLRNHQQARGRHGQPGRQGRAHAPRHRLLRGSDVRGFLHHRGGLLAAGQAHARAGPRRGVPGPRADARADPGRRHHVPAQGPARSSSTGPSI